MLSWSAKLWTALRPHRRFSELGPESHTSGPQMSSSPALIRDSDTHLRGPHIGWPFVSPFWTPALCLGSKNTLPSMVTDQWPGPWSPAQTMRPNGTSTPTTTSTAEADTSVYWGASGEDEWSAMFHLCCVTSR